MQIAKAPDQTPTSNFRRYVPAVVVAAGAGSGPAPLADDPTAARRAAIGYRRLSPYHPGGDVEQFVTQEQPRPMSFSGRGEQINARA